MSTPVLVGVVVAIVFVVAIIIVVARRKKERPVEQLPQKKEALPSSLREEPSEEPATAEPSGPMEPSREPEARAVEEGAVEEPAPGEPEEERESAKAAQAVSPEEVPAIGVRLDESAEEKAAAKLKEVKRERKLKKLRQGLAPTRGGLIAKIGSLFKEKKTIDPALLDELEEAMITADIGAKTTEWFLTLLREALDKNELGDPDAVWALLRKEVGHALSVEAAPLDLGADKPYVIMVAGVNGVGKTTTIGKLASRFTEDGRKIVLAAADTFRAAAVNQLEIWGRRTKCEVVKSKEGADPSSVVFDAIKRAKEIGADLVIADTAGRLHTQAPLMEELKKIARVAAKAHEGAPHQVLLVLDATTGQNALQQVKEFGEALDITGLVLTKLDGTAKGGVIIGICHEHKLPVRFIGVGEAKDDLREFVVEDFVDALFLRDDEIGEED